MAILSHTCTNIKLYSPICPCKIGEQTTDHTLYDCELVNQERDKLKADILRSGNSPINKDNLINKYTKIFTKFVDSVPLKKLYSIE